MLLTDGFGKAGGQCIQRFGSIRVLRNITIPTQRTASLQNPQRPIMALLATSWKSISETEYDNYVAISEILRGTNKWGEPRSFSPRECYTKLNALSLAGTNTLIDSSTFDQTIPVTTGTFVEVNTFTGVIDTNMTSFPIAVFYQLKAIRISNLNNATDIRKMKTFSRQTNLSLGGALFIEFTKTFGNVQPGQFFAFAVRGVSAYGIASDWVITKSEIL